MANRILLGAIADDFTGATDLANILVRGGMRTVQTIGIPTADTGLPECDAVVVALKSRTIPVGEAVAQSLAALEWLKARGARQFFFKVCSTFDSTDAGNIGQVADALLDALGEKIAVVCPAYPDNRRTVFQGHLFVGEALLSDSPMRNHPLTPMTDASLVRVMGRQSRHPVGLLPWSKVGAGETAINEELAALAAQGVRHAVVDAVRDQDLYAIGAASRNLRLLTGGAGLALGLPQNFREAGLLPVEANADALGTVGGAAAGLAGSCSEATRAQVADMARRCLAVVIDPLVADDAAGLAAAALGKAAGALSRGETVLFYSSADPAAIAAVQSRLGLEHAASLVEQTFALLAQALVAQNVRRLVVAGGETSGAVVGALGVKALAIGPQIDPGVPWTRVLGPEPLLLALKSGNFGRTDFFSRALDMVQ
ncbi:MAG: four-carbon acid sugar kinase family protein [Burkholderiaceae bacterium]|nr:four-carbon acid sugar kinase family protein [Burkholderiaceae bacterium]